jgi:hypothetical protein
MKINYEARFPIKSFLKDKIKKQWLKKDIKNNQVNLSNLWLEL